ncbi:MAG: tetratricopeptide repeat protein [Betaproteobacteria bacterium]|nr:tetratricopeptide repeat protein [Betaproteobacteria bacterium]
MHRLPHHFSAWLLCAALAACAQAPQAPQSGEAPAKSVTKPAPRVVVAKPAPRDLPLPAVELTEQLMLKMMLAEIAVQRGQPHVAVPAYLELARETRDPRVAQRATEIAWNARFLSAALEAAGIWLQADPQSAQARQIIAALLVNQAQLAEAQPHLEKWLAADQDNLGQGFLQLNSLLARHKDKPAVLKLMQALAQPYGNVPEARLAVAQAAWNANDPETALAEARAALKLKPGWELAALFQAQVLARRSSAEAVQFLDEYLRGHPGARDVRLNYARLLVNARDYAEARKQFEVLVSEHPANPDVTMAVALLAMQASDYDAAEIQLKRALEINYKDPDMARLYLGQVNEERKRFDEALKWYSTVGQGEQYINAQARYAGVLARQGKLGEARQHLRQADANTSQQRVQLTQAEAQLLREASEYQAAYELLGQALEQLPDYPDLLYDHAMAAEKVDRIDVLEGNLRKLIQIRPDHAHAYNALGYTLADRRQRIEEAHGLIETALKLAPEDPFIMDSMGWVLYRMGRSEQGLDFLQRAFALRPDPEIAAHLGEVLWAVGQRDQARKVWAGALKDHPKNETLQGTVKRFLP